MDRYGYVSNNYHGHAMAGQARAMAGSGGCSCSGHGTNIIPSSQQLYQKAPRNRAVIMTQPDYGSAMDFSREGRNWTTGICGCFEHCPSCMAAFFCPPCFACYLADRMNENMCGPMCGSPFCVALRTRLRDVNGIKGSICRDMFACYFCGCCNLSQMYREINNTME